MSNYRASSVKVLCEIKDVTEETAKLIRAVWKALDADELIEVLEDTGNKELADRISHHQLLSHFKRDTIDQLLGTYGIEYLGRNRRTRDSVYYCNAGETYATTILFHGDNLIVTTMGDYVEAGLLDREEW